MDQKEIDLGSILNHMQERMEALISRLEKLEQSAQIRETRGSAITTDISVKEECPEKTFPQKVTESLKELAMPANLYGFLYTRAAIVLIHQKNGELRSITRFLYPTLAEQFGTTPSAIERGIRHAIEVSFARLPHRIVTKYFGNSVRLNTAPTNSEFLFAVWAKTEGL